MSKRCLLPDAVGADGLSRRQALGAVATALSGGLGGCVRHGRALLARDAPKQVSLTVETVPADADPRATRIARSLATNLSAVGVDATVTPTSRERLYRDVLVNQQFDLYVAEFPGRADPDFLRGLLDSRFVADPGWQNPFGFADLDVDHLLEAQRYQTGSRRAETLAAIQREISRAQPFTVVAFPDEIRATRSDRVAGWLADLHSPLGYLSLSIHGGTHGGAASTTAGESTHPEATANATPSIDGNATRTPTPTAPPRATDTATPTATETATSTETTAPAGGRRPGEIRMALTDGRALENLNPLSVAFRDEGAITGLLYDPLGRRIAGTVRPWLAESWSWTGTDRGERVLELTLRDGVRWHDGTPIDAGDVAFTYRFLADTALGGLDRAVPAPRFRDRQSLVRAASALDDRTVRLRFRRASRRVARRALTVPVLPAHVWGPRRQAATLAGIDTGRTVTEALVWSNRDPVGSGPLRVESLATAERLTLRPFESHFLTRIDDPNLRPVLGGVDYDWLTFQRAPSSGTAVSMVRNGSVDGTATAVLPRDVPSIGRDPAVDLHVAPSRSFYHVGFNARRTPLGNPRFRRAVARLLDESTLVEEAFDGFAVPAASPLARHDALAPGLDWDGSDPGLAFVGEGGDLDPERARAAFERAGYHYDDEGDLLLS